MGSQYERELRNVLAGKPAGVRAVTRSCSEVERALAMLVIERPFLVVRAAGSGTEGTGDLLVLRGDVCFPIEVKSTKDRKLYLSGRTLEQYRAMRDVGSRCGLMPMYAQRLKGVRGDSWRLFRVDVGPLEGRLSVIARRLPALPLTRNGRPHLDWDKGMPLHRFLGLVCRRDAEAEESDAASRSAGIDRMLERLSERAGETSPESGEATAMTEPTAQALASNSATEEPTDALTDEEVPPPADIPEWADRFSL